MAIVVNKIDIDGVSISYAKAGHGPMKILCLPGAIGSWENDFKSVLERYDHEKFTIICWDPPGFGRSRPPNRDFSMGYNSRDAVMAHKLMQKLTMIPYCIMGWSDGGVTALYMAHQQKETKNIEKIIIWGSSAYITADQVMIYKNVIDTTKWAPENRQPYLDMYGEEYFQWAWKKHFEARIEIFEKYAGNKCKDILRDIPQQVLVLHGNEDIFVAREHSLYFKEMIPNASVVFKENGNHNLHKQYFHWFKELVENFFLSDS